MCAMKMAHRKARMSPGGFSQILFQLLQITLLLLPQTFSSDSIMEGEDGGMNSALHMQHVLSLSGQEPPSGDPSDIELPFIVTIPPILEEGPPKGELLFRVTHDPEKEPENLTIPCRADGIPLPSYSWFKDGNHFNTETPNVHTVEEEGTLVFPNPQPEDEGEYQCVATNSAGSAFSEIVSVKRAITISFPKGDPRVVTAILGQPLALECHNPGGYPVPTLHWVLQKSDGSLRSVSSKRATVDDDGTLWFSAVTLEDASDDALYACAASSATSSRTIFVVEGERGYEIMEEGEPAEEPYASLNLQTEYRLGNWVYLNVTAPVGGIDAPGGEAQVEPFIQHVTAGEKTVLKGDSLKLFCIYGGNPVPETKWWRDDGREIPSEHIVDFGKALEFEEITADDDGTYSCRARSEAGEGDIHDFTVNVEAIPEFVEEPGTINQPIGESVTFRCSAVGEPKPTITWSKNGEPIPDFHEESLSYDSLSIEDKAVIACNASNEHGYVYSTGFLNVLSMPPEFTEEPEDVTVFVGKRFELPCKSYGAPDPEVRWKKIGEDGEEEDIDEDDDLFEVTDSGLVIKSASDETDGDYVCEAVNKYGSVSSSVNVKLIRSTVVDIESSSEVVRAGQTATLRCNVVVDEYLSADVTWMKDDSPVDFSNPRISSEKGESDTDEDDDNYDRVLTITDSEGDDSGVYSCISNTEQDQAEDYAVVTVEDVPEPPEIKDIECAIREAYIKWTSRGENSSPITGFIIESQTDLNRDKWEEVENEIPASLSRVELKPGLTHRFRVIAVNRVGHSDPSAPSDPCVAPSAPPDNNPPNTVVTMVDSTTLHASWNAIEPQDHNGPDFRYEVRWKIFGSRRDDDGDEESTVVEDDDDDDDEDDDWSKLVIEDWEQTEVEIDGLRPHTRYVVQVAAVNEHGAAPAPEDILMYTEAGVPVNAPTHLRVRRVMDTTAILYWIPLRSDQVYGPLVGYEIDIKKIDDDDEGDDDDEDDEDDEEEEEERLITVGQTSRAELSDLEPFTKYEARVRVHNEKFAGPFTDPITFQTAQGDSSPVTDLKAKTLSSSSIIVEWDPPVNPRGYITSYVIHYQPIYEDDNGEGSEQEVVTQEDETQVKLPELEENTLYRITVFPRNKAGLGEGSVVEERTEETESSIPVPPIFSWGFVENEVTTTTRGSVVDRDNDNDVDDDDRRLQNVILTDVDGDGDIDEEDVLDTDSDGDIDQEDIDVADINNDGNVDEEDIAAADRDGDGDIDENDIGDEDGDGDFDATDVLIADEDGDGDIDSADEDEENVILQDFDADGDIDEDDATDVDGDGDIDQDDLDVLDVDDDGDIDAEDLKLADMDGDNDVDAADIVDLDGDGKIDEDDLSVRDVDDDGDIDRADYIYRDTFVADTDGDGDVDREDVLDVDRDGDIDDDDIDVADINNDGEVNEEDILAADRDGDGDVDASDIGDEDGDGDVDGTDVLVADEDGDGDIDAEDDDEEGVLFEDKDGDGDLDEDDVGDVDGDGDVDAQDIAMMDVDDDGRIDEDDLRIMDKDGDGDVDSADVVDFDGDGRIDEDDLEVVDRDGDGVIEAEDVTNQGMYLIDADRDGDVDEHDVLDLDGDGDVDEEDREAADLDDDGDVDQDDLTAFDKDGDGDIDTDDITDLDGDGKIDEDDFDVTDRDGDGDIDERDYSVRKIFLSDTDGDGDVDKDDVLDTDGDGDIDEEDVGVADIDNDGDVDSADVRAGDVDGDGDVDIADIGDEDGDGDIDGDDVEAADEDGDGDIDAQDDDGDNLLLTDKDNDGQIDEDDIGDVDGDGDVDRQDISALDIDNDGDVDDEDLKRGDRDGDGDIDAADIIDVDGDGDVDGLDLKASDRDGDGDIDNSDRRNKDLILGDADGDGDIDSEDVLDTDRDGDIDVDDFNAADINNDGEITPEDVHAADADGDGDIDVKDIGDVDGDGDVDASDVETADADGDGDIDNADRGEGINVDIMWRPDVEGNPGSEFYINYRPVGEEIWDRSPVEEKSLKQTIRGLDPYTAYEVQMVAKDGDFETPSNITVIGPFAQTPLEEPTMGAVMEEVDPTMMTWFVVAVIAAVVMLSIVFFSIWVYSQRLSRVSELRAQLYEGYEPPPVVEKEKKAPDVEANLQQNEVEEPFTAEKQRQQMSALLKRQETIQSVDSFASHDDDFAEYGDETMALDLLNSVSLITNPKQQGHPQKA